MHGTIKRGVGHILHEKNQIQGYFPAVGETKNGGQTAAEVFVLRAL